MYKKILAAIDLTPNENAVLEHTRQLARLVSATVHLLHVAPLHHIPGEIIGAADSVWYPVRTISHRMIGE
jgi:nucleotide-binding universal stress UspA family protein